MSHPLPAHIVAYVRFIEKLLTGSFVIPLQIAVRRWYRRRLWAAAIINAACFEYVLHPDAPARKRLLEKSRSSATAAAHAVI